MINAQNVLRIVILSLLGVYLPIIVLAEAGERGVGVTPAAIEIAERVEWPHTVGITVTNFSAETENFEVLVEKSSFLHNFSVGVNPGRFALARGASRRILLTFEEPKQAVNGFVKVLSLRNSLDGFTTGTGVKIPFYIEKVQTTKFLAGVGEIFSDRGFNWLFGAGMILVTIIFLWQIAVIIRSWIPLEVPKKQEVSQRAEKEVTKQDF